MKTHTQVQKSDFHDSAKVKRVRQIGSRDGLRLKSNNLRRGCRLQDSGAVQGRNESRQRVVAHHRGGREAQLAWGGIQEHDAFFGHEMRGQARTRRGGVSMAGGWEGQGARKGNGVEGPLLAITAMFCLEIAYVFGLSFSMRKVASEHPFCVLIYMNSYKFHIYCILFIFL